MRPFSVLLAIALGSGSVVPAAAQEGKLTAEFKREAERIAKNCSRIAPKALSSCAATLVTDHPLHVAFGSIAPLNGFGFGIALVAPQSKPTNDWRINWSLDGVGAPSGAWRAGAYLKIINSRVPGITVTGPGGGTSSTTSTIRPYPVITLYGQMITLPTIAYFGLGPSTTRDGRSVYELREPIVGGRAIWPFARSGVFQRLNLAAVGEINGRFPRVRGSSSDSDPSIETVYSDATAPGLSAQPHVVQFGEGVRINPSLAAGRLQLNYLANIQQFVAPSDSTYTFRRWTLDLRHEFSIYRTASAPASRDANGPNECATDVSRTAGEYGCPDPLSVSHNLTGSVGVRLLISRSQVSGQGVVPFYFQQTLGGSDINGDRRLASYDDYRFRGPHVMLLQETFEHSIWGPFGAYLSAEQGRVALQGDRLRLDDLQHTFGAGLTLRAGGVPMITISWAQGGSEGHHLIATMSTSLLGGSARPALQ
jgi:hypothetical protein